MAAYHTLQLFIIEGPDALAFVQKLATNDYSKKTAGSIQYTAMCDAQGNMIDDGTIWSLGGHKFMVVSGAESDFDWIESNTSAFNVTLKNITITYGGIGDTPTNPAGT